MFSTIYWNLQRNYVEHAISEAPMQHSDHHQVEDMNAKATGTNPGREKISFFIKFERQLLFFTLTLFQLKNPDNFFPF